LQTHPGRACPKPFSANEITPASTSTHKTEALGYRARQHLITDLLNGAHPVSDNDIHGLADKSHRLQQVITEIEVEVVAENGAIRVFARAGGQLEKIDLGLQAFDFSAAELGPIVAETIRAAEQAAESKAQEAVRAALGEQFMRAANPKGDNNA
jgi:DNA-binding protein YbaB